MRILHVNKFLYRRGGAESYALDLAALQRAAGDEVAFFGMDHPDNDPQVYQRFFPRHVELEPAPTALGERAAVVARMLWSTSSRAGLRSVIDDFRPDLVHLHNIYHQLSPSILAATRETGVPSVMTLHDYKLVCPNYQMLDHSRVCDACLAGGFRQAVRRRCKDDSLGASAVLAFESWLHRRLRAYDAVDAFVSPSRFLAAQLARVGVAPGRVHVVNHPVDVDSIPAKDLPGGPVVFVGRLSAEKGVDVLVRAVAALPATVRLDVAGEGPARPELEDLAERVAPGRVRFLGRLDRAGVLALLRGASVAAVPSRWHENQPMVVLEAQACGVPVVTTHLGGLPELVDDGVDGLVVAPDDPPALAAALGRLVADPERALAMGQAARRKVAASFSPARHLEGLASVYAAAARHTGRRPVPAA